ncbi:MAG: UDP-N-acetylglucosamine 2-epimerase (hydrolyzing) [Methyloprofundus sp.]|nr:UDP-N-acetylglucosamine 2-epimerase (hydrolyzing) [Methyloprofundus sp.]
MKKILALTGIRSEYDLLYPLLTELEADCEFDLGLIVSGAHLSPLHEYSVKQIEADGFKIVSRIESLIFSNTSSAKVNGIGNMLSHLSAVLARETPDYLLVLGDREEVLAGAMAGAYMGVPVAHIAGGDNTCPIDGDVDEEVRHAASKLSHIHFTMAEAHSQRLLRMGEEAWRVHTVGNGGLDKIRMTPVISREDLTAIVSPKINDDFAVMIYHTLSSYSQEQVKQELNSLFEEAIGQGLTLFVGAPNSDPGFDWVLNVYKTYESHPQVVFYRNLSRLHFVNLLRHATCLLGNSSLGVLEAGYMGLPVINVGERQRGRLADVNVQYVSAERESVSNALVKIRTDKAYIAKVKRGSELYGDGYMAKKVLAILKDLPERKLIIAKKMSY